MPSTTDNQRQHEQRMLALPTTREDYRIAWLSALAIMIHITETALPSPIPGVKPGLANVITIAVLIEFGWGMAAWVSLLRVLAGSILIGTFLSPGFLLSLSGAVTSIAVLRAACLLPGRGFGAIGYSLLAAMAHMSGQFLVAWLLFIPHPAIWHLYPVLLTLSVFFGVISGILASKLVRRVKPERRSQASDENPV
jgi:heptaprenyl diphosphate synthase